MVDDMSKHAHQLFTAGDITASRSELEQMDSPTLRDRELLGIISYLQGRYGDAVSLLADVAAKSALNPLRQYRARRYLSLTYLQTNRFDMAASLPLRDPLTKLMRAFTTDPYQLTWSGARETVLPFIQDHTWELPRVTVTANGTQLIAKIDTGGDMFSLPWSDAEAIGVKSVTTSVGWFAGGRRARTGHGILEHLDLGGATVTNLPISINSFDHAVVGTGLLRQFTSTLDYPAAELVLRPRQHGAAGSGFPLLMAGTHLLIAEGAVNGLRTRMLVDSGLEVTNEGCFLAPESTLLASGIPVPKSATVEGSSGAGRGRLEIGEFTVEELRLGTETRRDVIGLTGIFPPQLTKAGTIGFPLGGLVSHNFLRHYRWTLDFDGMTMSLE